MYWIWESHWLTSNHSHLLLQNSSSFLKSSGLFLPTLYQFNHVVCRKGWTLDGESIRRIVTYSFNCYPALFTHFYTLKALFCPISLCWVSKNIYLIWGIHQLKYDTLLQNLHITLKISGLFCWFWTNFLIWWSVLKRVTEANESIGRICQRIVFSCVSNTPGYLANLYPISSCDVVSNDLVESSHTFSSTLQKLFTQTTILDQFHHVGALGVTWSSDIAWSV